MADLACVYCPVLNCGAGLNNVAASEHGVNISLDGKVSADFHRPWRMARYGT